ncbi:MAG: hypothetical protein HKO53_08390, partial [Gemmatimonadetes bacterium]|nr:hypothetical protein [Gemmatimonadota bacterium]
MRVFAALFPFLVSFLRDRKRWFVIGKPATRAPEHHAKRANRLTATIAALGPTFIKLAGVSDEEELRAGWLDSVRSRLPWLVLNLVT